MVHFLVRRLPFFALMLLLRFPQPVIGQEERAEDQQETHPGFLTDTSLLSAENYFSYAAISLFYGQRQYQLAWFSGRELKPAADSLLQFIHSAEQYGLLPSDYQMQELKKVQELSRPGLNNKAQLERAELLFSDSFLKLAYHLRFGRLQKNTDIRAQHLPQGSSQQFVDLLQQAAAGKKPLRLLLEQQQPAHLPYIFLKEELGRFLNEQDTGSLNSGARDEKELKIKKLKVNMERWRWEAEKLPDTYLLVNIPAYRLQLFELGQPLMESRVIVGKPGTPSPQLSGIIDCIIIYPYWTVPRSIALYEILPKVQKDPAYLSRNHFEILDRNWKRVNPAALNWNSYSPSHFPFIFRQTEGPHNALGVVKFMFDNDYAVYLHDTNAPHLFENSYRALSHGCIRVEKYRHLARLLLRNDPVYSQSGMIDSVFNIRRRKEISLARGVPLYIRYFTAEYLEDGLHFYQDIYRKDEKLFRALFTE